MPGHGVPTTRRRPRRRRRRCGAAPRGSPPARPRSEHRAASARGCWACRWPFRSTAPALLGLGPGLTPAGDDFTGGAFFARALLARAGIVDAAAWQAGASAVRTAAARLTHPIGAALLGW